MKKSISLLVCFLALQTVVFAQPANYYNGTETLDGANLKTALHNIIDGHTAFEYGTVKQILKSSDEDPNNSDNIILVYTGWSIPKSDFASNLDSLNYWNREHVWAKSHGDFGTDMGPGTDAHGIKPVDATVNSARSYLDFDEGGTEYYDAGVPTGSYKDNDSWEPRDEDKGDIARIIFYMATRYEGTNGELDLEVVDAVNTYPAPEHGKLSTLLQWNLQDPPDEFEKNRNDIVFDWQGNRNPFIDYPEFAEYIWNGVSANPIIITNLILDPADPIENDIVNISSEISHNSGGTINSATLFWGLSWSSLSNTISLSASGNIYTGQIPGQLENTRVYYKIVASDGTEEKYFFGYYDVAPEPFSGTLTSIYDIQGQTTNSPYQGQTVSITGVVTGAFGSNFFLQNGSGAWNGVYVYSSGHFPTVGDSIIITAEVDEYYDLTEMKNISAYYHISANNSLPEAVLVQTGAMQDEQYEAVLVQLENAMCVRDTTYGMWFVNDGSGDALIHNSSIYSHSYVIGQIYNITGPLNFDFGEYKIELRSADDVVEPEDVYAPIVSNISIATETVIYVTFNEDIAGSSVAAENFSINHNITVENASLHTFDNTMAVLTVSALSEGNYTMTINGVEDLAGNIVNNLIVYFSDPTNISNIENSDYQVYPNPCEDILFIDLGVNSNFTFIEIFDISGRSIYFVETKITEKNHKHSVDISGLKNGIYFLKIRNEDDVLVEKIVVE
ncbi:MAG: T9SS type A sorting domain-containing protein [Bacteroidetes bacterium]|jgi:endonuclease I|nr:T9SS type A sorting domain-containing protein [Bacteroidota bacterium]MBT6687145.1 T9SS type A sorting domain-containing protein [Bacteroidota bacterium]MBT7144918.1 T9SS type A sorting domain-containing protein [Bacteroidota bacterium]MBT7492163.1 T9SS type A sorting domain-containing protein [Bacteroidota bacterium]